jgi:phage shock protein PspC (stress-responsive transcriptional regulator)
MNFYCYRCGAGLPVGARFCSSCGTVVAATAPPPGRPLVRPILGRQIAGVCAALAQSNGWDVTAIRIIAIVGFFMSGGLVAVGYLAGWIGIPEEPIMPVPGMYPPQPPPP